MSALWKYCQSAQKQTMLKVRLCELWILYVDFAQGRSPSLPKARMQYGDYALWQERTNDDWTKSHIRPDGVWKLARNPRFANREPVVP
jgi:hypothetical protein